MTFNFLGHKRVTRWYIMFGCRYWEDTSRVDAPGTSSSRMKLQVAHWIKQIHLFPNPNLMHCGDVTTADVEAGVTRTVTSDDSENFGFGARDSVRDLNRKDGQLGGGP